jgi:ribonuclease BN (tRNA processing enzyme)
MEPDEDVKAWLLGSGGFVPSGRRDTTCVLIRRGPAALVLDAGTGLRRLLTEPGLLDGATSLDILLTHFHLDHVVGLGYTPALPLLPTIWAPGRWLYDRPSADILAPLRTPPLSPFSPDEFGDVRELVEAPQEVAGMTIRVRRQDKHWGPTAGLRVDDAIALVTDTAADDGSIGLAAGVAHLLHEAWFTSAEAGPDAGHSTAADAGRIAALANAGRLTLVHLNPQVADEAALLADAQRHMAETAVGEDGARLEL